MRCLVAPRRIGEKVGLSRDGSKEEGAVVVRKRYSHELGMRISPGGVRLRDPISPGPALYLTRDRLRGKSGPFLSSLSSRKSPASPLRAFAEVAPRELNLRPGASAARNLRAVN
jgi:hypothetical protein